MTRARLPDRRGGISFTFLAGFELGKEHTFHATAGFYPDGRIGEVFITSTKVANSLQVIANEAAVAISFALQHGADAESMRDAMPREEDGRPQGVMGALLDAVCALPGPDASDATEPLPVDPPPQPSLAPAVAEGGA